MIGWRIGQRILILHVRKKYFLCYVLSLHIIVLEPTNSTILSFVPTQLQGSMFHNATAFNQDISGWDVSKVKVFISVFEGAESFAADLSRWNTSSVEDMSYTFANARSFNSDLSGWDTSKVKSMRGMFSGASSFNGDVSTWNTTQVNQMNDMFRGADSFSGSLCWDTSGVNSGEGTFAGEQQPTCVANVDVCGMFCGSGGGGFDAECVADAQVLAASQDCPETQYVCTYRDVWCTGEV